MILNYGSLNIDRVFEVPYFVRPGETITATNCAVLGGGKGANQSVALARAGAKVRHAGKVGTDGIWLVNALKEDGVDISDIKIEDGSTGQAIIQVTPEGENAILLSPGMNHQITFTEISQVLAKLTPEDWVLLQNEINEDALELIVSESIKKDLQLALNPAPMKANIFQLPLEKLRLLVVNELEAEALFGQSVHDSLLQQLTERFPKTQVIITLGKQGVIGISEKQIIRIPAIPVQAIDTTAAGDTFIGYFLAGWDRHRCFEKALREATVAAALSVTKKGAMASIPYYREVSQFYNKVFEGNFV